MFSLKAESPVNVGKGRAPDGALIIWSPLTLRLCIYCIRKQLLKLAFPYTITFVPYSTFKTYTHKKFSFPSFLFSLLFSFILFVYPRFRFLVICLTFAYVRCTILRLPCQSEAFFTVLKPGKILPNAVIQTLPKASKNECAKACFDHPKCKSLNYCTGNGCGCELNSKYAGMIGTALIDKENWAYMSTDYEATEVRDSSCKTMKF